MKRTLFTFLSIAIFLFITKTVWATSNGLKVLNDNLQLCKGLNCDMTGGSTYGNLTIEGTTSVGTNSAASLSFEVNTGNGSLDFLVGANAKDAVSLGDAGTAGHLPFIQWLETPNGTRGMYMGWGSNTGSKFVGIGLENSYNLNISGGLVGLGTTAPTDDFTIEVGASQFGAIETRESAAGVAAFGDAVGGGTNGIVELFNGATEGVRLFSNGNSWVNYGGGNFGINTAAPGKLFDVEGNSQLGVGTYTSGAVVDIGSTGTDYPATSGWSATYNTNILLNSVDTATISFHDASLSVGELGHIANNFFFDGGQAWSPIELGTNTRTPYAAIDSIGTAWFGAGRYGASCNVDLCLSSGSGSKIDFYPGLTGPVRTYNWSLDFDAYSYGQYRISNYAAQVGATTGIMMKLNDSSGEPGSQFKVTGYNTANGSEVNGMWFTLLGTTTGKGALSVNGSLYDSAGVGWNNLTFSAGWSNYGSGFQSVQYKKFGDMVFLRGLATSGANQWGTYTEIGVLPAGYRPTGGRLVFPRMSNAGHSRLDITTSGNVIIVSGGTSTGWFNLDNTFFSVD